MRTRRILYSHKRIVVHVVPSASTIWVCLFVLTVFVVWLNKLSCLCCAQIFHMVWLCSLKICKDGSAIKFQTAQKFIAFSICINFIFSNKRKRVFSLAQEDNLERRKASLQAPTVKEREAKVKPKATEKKPKVKKPEVDTSWMPKGTHYFEI